MINFDDRLYDLPFIALRGLCVFPGTSFNVDLLRRKSYDAMESAVEGDGLVFMVAQIDAAEDAVREDNLYGTGVIAKIKKVVRMPGGIARISAEALMRARIRDIDEDTSNYLKGKVVVMDSFLHADNIKIDALTKLLSEVVSKYSSLNPRFFDTNLWELTAFDDFSDRLDAVAARVELSIDEKQSLLEQLDVFERGMELARLINKENSVLELKKELAGKVKERIDKEQRRYYLREQLKVITEELGDDGVGAEISEYKSKIASLNLPDYAVQKLEKELERLKRLPMGAQEGSVIRDYIDEVLALPWGVYSQECTSLEKAEKILNRDHYGLEKVKERIVEFLAVKLTGSSAGGSILCLVGPPGVGKTSIARSVATALNRKYVRLSLGGMHDEAEIRGHRKTYIGAMPGRIISAIKQAGTSNPLVLLDEIDKLGSDYKGDPSSALLEVLDSEQNYSFRDNYLDMPYDLSRVLFICTANSLDTIPVPLRDRMDIIELSSYTYEEKLAIAKKYLYTKQLERHCITKDDLKLKAGALKALIEGYTREAGVRQAERLIEKLCRIAVKSKLISGEGISVDAKNIDTYLGKRIFKGDRLNKRNEVGICRGLAWTAVGGTTLEIEVNTYKGKGGIKITGNVGKVMEESSTAAVSFIKANADRLGITTDFENTEVHIHIPEGATPKDGPSAGVTMATALISALTDTPVRYDIAMTGEINIRGRVMPIGGLKEKVLAAKRVGVKTVIIPEDNSADLDEIPDYAKDGLTFVLADTMDTVLKNALV